MNHTTRPSRNNRPVATEPERHAKISIWWDIENCPIPTNCFPPRISNNFLQALRQANFEGNGSISLFGDALQVGNRLINCGLRLYHVPSDASVGRILMNHVFSWAHDHPPPANILLISGDVDAWQELIPLKESGYNVILAHQTTTPTMNPPADIVWQFTSLLNGEPPEPIQI